MAGVAPPLAPLPEVERRRARLAVGLWIAFTAAVLVACARLGPERQSVVRHYRAASHAWLEGRPIYADGGEHGFLYLPTFAVAHVPFAALPLKPGGLLWRAANLALLGLGAWLLARALGRERRGTAFLALSVVTLACCWSSAKHGQATLAMAGAMLAGCAMLVERRLAAAAAWLVAGVALKPLAVALLLVVAALWPRAGLRMLPLALVAAALPFLTQSPDYVLAQVEGFVRMIREAGEPLDRERFPDLFLSLRELGIALSPTTTLLVRALAGLVTLGALAWARRRADDRVLALLLYGLVACYLLGFNPRTEHNTYSLIGPALGGFAAWALLEGRSRAAVAFGVLALLPRIDFDVAKALSGDSVPWVKPILLAVAVAAMWLYARRRGWRFERRAISAGSGAAP
jgi:alpha-1,2-mannosyltransferase